MAKDGSGRSEDDVAHEGEFAAATELREIRTISELMNEEPWRDTYSVSAHGSDDWLADLGEVRPAFEEAVLVNFRVYSWESVVED